MRGISSIFCMIFWIIAIVLVSITSAKIIYVDDDAAGVNNGSSWVNAYKYLQDALADANSAEKPVEIRVAQGIYRPAHGANQIAGDRMATFQLINNVILKGGFAGIGELDADVRDVEAYETILSGDLNGDDVEVANVEDLEEEPTRAENSYHVVTGNLTETAVLDGLVITGGNANGHLYPYDSGGGLCVKRISSSPTVANCTFTGNLADWGGGVFVGLDASATVSNCLITANIAYGANARGGGIYCEDDSGPTEINSCTIRGNVSKDEGGGIYLDNDSWSTVKNCNVIANLASDGGGGIYCDNGSNSTITNCVLAGNRTVGKGAGIYFEYCCPEVTCCTVSGNSALISGGGICSGYGSSPTINSCIVWGNISPYGPQISLTNTNSSHLSSITVRYCDAQDGEDAVYLDKDCTLYWSTGNIDSDPCFADPGHWDPNGTADDPNDDFWVDGDYHLKSQAGRWDPKIQAWVRDDITSPCIDAGDPNSDWTGELWPHGQRINMGAYGGTEQASMSARPESLSLPHVAYIFSYNLEAAQSFQSLLEAFAISVTLIDLDVIEDTSLTDYDLIIVGIDTAYPWTKDDNQPVAAAIDSWGKPIVGLGEGGYYFFGQLGLSIGFGHGWHASENSIYVVDIEHSVFSMPYPIDIPQDRILQLYTQTGHVGILRYPSATESVVAIGREVSDLRHYPLIFEHDRYLFWGFTGYPENMTEDGKLLFINVVIRTANAAW